MAVFVDDVRHNFGRMVMCHMWADSREELLAMATRIGVAHRWLQGPPKASWIHFDISLSKKSEAIRHGAILTDRYGPVLFENTRRVGEIEARIIQIESAIAEGADQNDLSGDSGLSMKDHIEYLKARVVKCQEMIDTVHKIRAERSAESQPNGAVTAGVAEVREKPAVQASFGF